MKFYTPEKNELIEITEVEPHPNGLLVGGRIMGAMPMKAILRPEELRGAFRFASAAVVLRLLRMLFARSTRG
ncbi:hypothetical protein JQ604_24100 [Bradyrhizobium jicamae]|uniref:hypothetical protein n=1 Tax=Bradyrhizobium jicamae TaxID=280332 RepID=UPI001BA75544|nr:hypothetical protein [Bradyrhizobium jicamae]MBR0755278.1 hypothetical protein [Bradyrhizobium jicamae]